MAPVDSFSFNIDSSHLALITCVLSIAPILLIVVMCACCQAQKSKRKQDENALEGGDGKDLEVTKVQSKTAAAASVVKKEATEIEKEKPKTEKPESPPKKESGPAKYFEMPAPSGHYFELSGQVPSKKQEGGVGKVNTYQTLYGLGDDFQASDKDLAKAKAPMVGGQQAPQFGAQGTRYAGVVADMPSTIPEKTRGPGPPPMTPSSSPSPDVGSSKKMTSGIAPPPEVFDTGLGRTPSSTQPPIMVSTKKVPSPSNLPPPDMISRKATKTMMASSQRPDAISRKGPPATNPSSPSPPAPPSTSKKGAAGSVAPAGPSASHYM